VRLREVLLSLPITVEAVTLDDALGEVADLARLLDLTAYDTAYVALAARRGIPLATADGRLRLATAQAGVETLGD
jgi:predicted nucleic acid-binding protein